MPSITIELSEPYFIALSTVCYDPQEWSQNAVVNRARIAFDELLQKEIQRRFEANEAILTVKEENITDAYNRGIIKTVKQIADEQAQS